MQSDNVRSLSDEQHFPFFSPLSCPKLSAENSHGARRNRQHHAQHQSFIGQRGENEIHSTTLFYIWRVYLLSGFVQLTVTVSVVMLTQLLSNRKGLCISSMTTSTQTLMKHLSGKSALLIKQVLFVVLNIFSETEVLNILDVVFILQIYVYVLTVKSCCLSSCPLEGTIGR